MHAHHNTTTPTRTHNTLLKTDRNTTIYYHLSRRNTTNSVPMYSECRRCKDSFHDQGVVKNIYVLACSVMEIFYVKADVKSTDRWQMLYSLITAQLELETSLVGQMPQQSVYQRLPAWYGKIHFNRLETQEWNCKCCTCANSRTYPMVRLWKACYTHRLWHRPVMPPHLQHI